MYLIGELILCIISLIYEVNVIREYEKELIDYVTEFEVYNRVFKEFFSETEENSSIIKNYRKYTECLFIYDCKNLLIKEFMEKRMKYELINNGKTLTIKDIDTENDDIKNCDLNSVIDINDSLFGIKLNDIIFFSHNLYKDIILCEIITWFNKKVFNNGYTEFKKSIVEIPNISFSCILKLDKSLKFDLQHYKLLYKNLFIMPLVLHSENRLEINTDNVINEINNDCVMLDLSHINQLIYTQNNEETTYIFICEILKHVCEPYNATLLLIHNRISELTEVFANF